MPQGETHHGTLAGKPHPQLSDDMTDAQLSLACPRLGSSQSSREFGRLGRRCLGAKDCTPEINTSEIIVDVQWHVPMDCQWHVQKEFHLSVVCSKGLSLVQWICTGVAQWISVACSHGIYISLVSGV